MAAIDLGRSGAFEDGDSAMVLATAHPDANQAPPARRMNPRRLETADEVEESLIKVVRISVLE
jgi:hypothetical protein